MAAVNVGLAPGRFLRDVQLEAEGQECRKHRKYDKIQRMAAAWF